MQVEQNGDGDGEQIRPDRLRRHPDRVIHWEREGERIEKRHSSSEHIKGGTFVWDGFWRNRTQLNLTGLGRVWVYWVLVLVLLLLLRLGWWICWWGRRQPVIVSKFSYSPCVSLSLSVSRGTSAFSNWNVLHHISAHYHLLLVLQRSRHFTVLPVRLLQRALPCPCWAECSVQQRTWQNSSLATRVNCAREPQEQCAALTIVGINLQTAQPTDQTTSSPCPAQPSSSSLSTPSWAHDKKTLYFFPAIFLFVYMEKISIFYHFSLQPAL